MALVSMPFYDRALATAIQGRAAQGHRREPRVPSRDPAPEPRPCRGHGSGALSHELSEHDRGRSAGDWLFSPAAFGVSRRRRPVASSCATLGDRLQFDEALARGTPAMARRCRPVSGPVVREVAWESLPGRRIHVHLRGQTVPSSGHGGPAQASVARARRGLRRCQLRGLDGCRTGAHDGLRRLRRHRGGGRRVHRPPRHAERGMRPRRAAPGIACRRDGAVVDGAPLSASCRTTSGTRPRTAPLHVLRSQRVNDGLPVEVPHPAPA